MKPGSEPGFAAQVWGWSASANFPINAANISSLTAQTLLQQGHVPLSYFTGNPTDTNHGVWLIGRDIAAGARIAALANAGYGSLSTVRQFRVFTNTETVTLGIEPSGTVDGVAVAQCVANYVGNLSSAQMRSISGSIGYLNTKELNVFRNNDGSRIFRK